MSATRPSNQAPGGPFDEATAMPAAIAWYYAGFWWRVLAWLVDIAVLRVVEMLVGLATGLREVGVTITAPSDSGPVSNVAYSSLTLTVPGLHLDGGGLTLLGVLLTLAYFSLLESSRWQATLGKRVCRLRVTDLGGGRIGLGRAIGRNLAKFVSWFVLGIGFLMVAGTRRKQGLHDLMADTLVVRRRPADLLFGFQPPPRP